MKKILFFLVLLIASSCTRTVRIEGVVSGDTDGVVVYLMEEQAPTFDDVIVDSVLVSDGKFSFTVPNGSSLVKVMLGNDGINNKTFFVSSGVTNIVGDMGSYYDAKLSGNDVADKIAKLEWEIAIYSDRQEALWTQKRILTKTKGMHPELIRMKSEFYDREISALDGIAESLKRDAYKKNSDNIFGLYAATLVTDYTVEEMDDILSSIPSGLSNSILAEKLRFMRIGM